MEKLENWIIIIGLMIITTVLIFYWKDFSTQQPYFM
jgi:hypothetical protein